MKTTSDCGWMDCPTTQHNYVTHSAMIFGMDERTLLGSNRFGMRAK
jgi:hypothetical protein